MTYTRSKNTISWNRGLVSNQLLGGLICKGNHWAHVHQGGVFDVLINGFTAELDDRVDSATATLIIARVGRKTAA